MRRVLIMGISGAGKSTLARTLSARLGVPYVEIDALFHGPGWVRRPEFEADVQRFSAQPAWITDGQYQTHLGTLLWERADTVVWLDLSRRVVMQRVIRRSILRAITRRPLWNGNRESARNWLRADHPIRWAWSQHGLRRERTQEMVADPRFAHLDVHRLRTPREVKSWLTRVAGDS